MLGIYKITYNASNPWHPDSCVVIAQSRQKAILSVIDSLDPEEYDHPDDWTIKFVGTVATPRIIW